MGGNEVGLRNEISPLLAYAPVLTGRQERMLEMISLGK